MHNNNIHAVLEERQKRYEKAISDSKAFFAFSDTQFTEGMAGLGLTTSDEDTKRITYIGGAGGYILKDNAGALVKAMKAVDDWFASLTPEGSTLRTDYIRYELANHEAGYTGDIESTLDAIGERFTAGEVLAVFNEKYAHIYA